MKMYHMPETHHENFWSGPRKASVGEEKKFRIVFWGLGSIGSRLARLVLEHFDYDVVACRSNGGKANPLGIQEISDRRELDDFSPHIAFITNPTSLHMDVAMQCAAKGMHLFVEKPLSHSMDGSDDLLRIIRQNGNLTYVGCNLRFHPLIQHLKTHYQPDPEAHARVICSSYLPGWHPKQDYSRSYSAKTLGGGVILDLIHEPDYCAWLFGKIDRIEGAAGKISNLKIETEDFADMVLYHASGFKSHIQIDYTGRIPQRKLEIFGEATYLEADLLARTLTTAMDNSKGTFKLNAIDPDYTYLEELKYFFQCVENGRKPMNNIEEHLSVLKPVLDFKASRGL